MTHAERLRKMQDTLARHEAEFLELRTKAEKNKLDGIAAEIRRVRLEIDAFLGLPPAGRPRAIPQQRPKQIGTPRPGQETRGRAPDWRGKSPSR